MLQGGRNPEDWKLVSRVNGKDELYDLKSDPKEQHNSYGAADTSTITAALKEKQLLWLMRTADAVPFDYDSRFSPEMSWAKVKHLVPKEYEAEMKA